MDRVYYYSNSDLSTGYYLEKAESRIYEIKSSSMPSDLEGMIELWHIYRMLNDGCQLQRWSEETFATLKKATESYNSEVARFFKTMEPFNVKTCYEALEWGYRRSFWDIVEQFKCFDRIHPNVLREIISENVNDLRFVLQNKSLVEKFKVIIRDELLVNKWSAHIILDKFVTRTLNSSERSIFLPSILTIEEKEYIIIRYLDSEDPNINYVRLICQAKDIQGQFILSAKTRYKAIKLEKRLNNELMTDSRSSVKHFRMEIEFSDDKGVEVYSYSNEKGYPQYIYSRKYIIDCPNEARIAYCANVFHWFNNHLLLNLINKNCEVDGIEMAFIDKGRYAYPSFQMFQHKNSLSLHQLNGYSQILRQIGSSFEDELKVFYEQKLKDEFGYPSVSIKLPKNDDDWLVKCRIIFPELDNLARQYDTYVNEDEIDPEYMALLKPMKMTDSKSLLTNKYLEQNENNEDVKKLLYCLFSPNTILGYVEPFKDLHYHSLVELMDHESVCYANYESHQKTYIDFLIEKNIIAVNSEGLLEYRDKSAVDILKSVWEFGVCSYWHLDDIGRKAADCMIEKKWFVTDDHLLSNAERKYFSYYTDNAEFTNGYAYRNHYSHGNTPPVEDVNAHAVAYFVMLRLLTILIIKIYDDLWLARKTLAVGLHHKFRNKLNDE